MRIKTMALVMLSLIASVQAKEPAVRDTHWLIKLKVSEGTAAERELGKCQMLSAPQVMSIGNQPFLVQIGSAVQAPQTTNEKPQFAQCGLLIQGKCQRVEKDVLQLDLNCHHSALAKNTSEGIEIQGTSLHVIKRVTAGKTSLFTTKAVDEKTKQTWIEVTVEDVTPKDE